ncbi:pilin [Dyella sp. 2HG41-7]|uniref:pilin n=1 Tax=Dyella sp. 2HG41-7 TaxID=2883239 RepID=UPI001F2FCB87|nr:pilin [Dyella sp. 2HG41-7]
MKTMQKGFTLIELMIVVAIIAILAAIAIPQYQNYITKAQFSETQTIADGLKTPIVEYYNQTGQCPNNGQGGISLDTSYFGKYVATATTSGGGGPCVITMTFKPSGSVSSPLVGQSVTFTGTNNGGTFSWVCADAALDQKYKPAACN